jgi:FecR-like protein
MTFDPRPGRGKGALRLAIALAVIAGTGLPAVAEDGLAVVRTVEGAAAVERVGMSGPVVENGTLAKGDWLTTARDARVEVMLADGTVLHVAGDSELVLADLAGPDTTVVAPNRLVLARGELLVTGEGPGGTRVDTDNATVFVVAGVYRVEHGDGWTSVVTRDGEAELRSPRGAVRVAIDEQAWVEADGVPVVEAAGLGDSLERWAALLDGQRERLARRWLYYDYGDDEIAWDDDDFWMWDAGPPICSDHHYGDHHGDAHRTRPPSGTAVPVDSEPGRVATPIDRDGGGGDVQAGWTRPARPGDADGRTVHLPRTAEATPAPDGGWVATEIAGESGEPEPATPSTTRATGDDGGIWRHLGAIAARLIGADDDSAPTGAARTRPSSTDASGGASSSSSDDTSTSSSSSSNDSGGSSSEPSSSNDTSSSSSSSSSSSNDVSASAPDVSVHVTVEPPPPPDREPNR